MKKLLSTLLAVIGLSWLSPTTASAHEDAFNVFIYAITGPLKADSNYVAWATAEVGKMRMSGNLDADDIGHQLMVTDIAQPQDLSNTNALWFAVRIVSKDPSVMLSLSELRFIETSSDGGYDSLGNVYDLRAIQNLVYNPRAIGVIWSTNGPGTSDTILDNELASGSTPVNEIDFIGMQSTYYDYSPNYPYSSVEAYVESYTNYLLSASCSVIDTNGTVLALGQKTLQAKGSPFVPILTDGVAPDNQIQVGAIMETNTTIKVYHSATINPPSWSLTATMNAGDLLMRTNDGFGFFKAKLE